MSNLNALNLSFDINENIRSLGFQTTWNKISQLKNLNDLKINFSSCNIGEEDEEELNLNIFDMTQLNYLEIDL